MGNGEETELDNAGFNKWIDILGEEILFLVLIYK